MMRSLIASIALLGGITAARAQTFVSLGPPNARMADNVDWSDTIAGVVARIDINVIIVALIPVIVLVLTQRANRKAIEASIRVSVANSESIKAVAASTEKIQVQTDGMSERLATMAEAKGHAEGMVVGAQQEKDKNGK